MLFPQVLSQLTHKAFDVEGEAAVIGWTILAVLLTQVARKQCSKGKWIAGKKLILTYEKDGYTVRS